MDACAAGASQRRRARRRIILPAIVTVLPRARQSFMVAVLLVWFVASDRTGRSRLSAQPHPASHGTLRAIPGTILERPPVKRAGIGRAHEVISTTAAGAQEWYDIGLAHLHSFAWLDAARAFNAALRLDPQCAMAHAGLSFAFGGLGAFQGAVDEIARAQRAVSPAAAHDRLRIALRQQQLQVLSGALASDRYVAALDQALTAAPKDVELLLLRGEAGSGDVAASGHDSGASGVVYYQRAQQADANAFAPRHYLAHAYENSGQTALALRESEVYATMAPAVPHAHHMVGHSLRRLGRTSEAIARFEQADALAQAAFASDQVPPEYDWHTHHNTALLAAAYRYVGRLQAAAQRLEPAFTRAAPLLPEELTKRAWPALLLVRGRVVEAATAALQLTLHGDPLVRGAGHLATAQVHLSAGRVAAAGLAADAALRELRQAGAAASELAPDLRMTQGVFLLRSSERDRERARTMVRDAMASWRARNGPDAWSDTLFALELTFRLVRQADDRVLAAEVAEQMRQHDPLYAGTSFALALVAEARGDRAAARAAYTEAIARWQAADPDHPDAQTARARLASLS